MGVPETRPTCPRHPILGQLITHAGTVGPSRSKRRRKPLAPCPGKDVGTGEFSPCGPDAAAGHAIRLGLDFVRPPFFRRREMPVLAPLGSASKKTAIATGIVEQKGSSRLGSLSTNGHRGGFLTSWWWIDTFCLAGLNGQGWGFFFQCRGGSR